MFTITKQSKVFCILSSLIDNTMMERPSVSPTTTSSLLDNTMMERPSVSPATSTVDLKNKKNKNKGKKVKLSKEDIGKPSDFR